MAYNLKWGFGNSKVGKLDAVSFGLPAFKSLDGFKTCPKAGTCAAICYARQGTYRFKSVVESREFNLDVARRQAYDFENLVNQDLEKIKKRLIRIHDSGDFCSQFYLESWMEIARCNPEKLFYAYTKSLHLDFSDAPDNMTIVQSEGGLMDATIDKNRPHSRIFATDYQRRQAGYGNGSKTDTLAIRGATRIGLVYHGGKHLTETQKATFDGGKR